MNEITHRLRQLNDNPDIALDLIRIYLGIGLFVRGILFVSDASMMESLVDMSQFSFASAALVHYVAFAHLVGGAMMAVGLFSRAAAAVQIPVLFGAVFLVHVQDGLMTASQSLEFSALVLVLLVVVALFGSGRWSADYYIEHEQEARREAARREAAQREEMRDRAPVPRDRQPVPAGATAATATAGAGAEAADAFPIPVVPRRATKSEKPAVADTECMCGYDLNHPRVTVEPKYSIWAGFYFMLGISAPVKEVVFYCEECGTVMKRSRDPELLNRYRYHTS